MTLQLLNIPCFMTQPNETERNYEKEVAILSLPNIFHVCKNELQKIHEME